VADDLLGHGYVLFDNGHNRLNSHVVMVFMPAVIVSGKRDDAVADLSFPGRWLRSD
jgi:hypothetical protein